MENGIVINGIKHVLTPTSFIIDNCDDCKICSLKRECDQSDSCFCCDIFSNTPNSHFEIEK